MLLFVVGLGLAGGVYTVNTKERELRAGWIAAEGTVAEVVKRRGADGDRFVPLVVFQTRTGNRVSFTGARAVETPHFAVGEQVRVRYPPPFPERAEIDYRRERWLRNAIAGGAAVILMALGAYVAWYASRLQRALARDGRA